VIFKLVIYIVIFTDLILNFNHNWFIFILNFGF
jgi:hypothetical protein